MAKHKLKRFWRKKILRNFHLQAKKITIILIAVSMVLVAVAVAVGLWMMPEQRIHRQVEAMAVDYYENYFYKNFSDTVGEDTVADGLAKYAEKGFGRVPVKQLLLFDGGKYHEYSSWIKEYCDTDASVIQIFPVDPYGPKNYRVDYKYSCNF